MDVGIAGSRGATVLSPAGKVCTHGIGSAKNRSTVEHRATGNEPKSGPAKRCSAQVRHSFIKLTIDHCLVLIEILPID